MQQESKNKIKDGKKHLQIKTLKNLCIHMNVIVENSLQSCFMIF